MTADAPFRTRAEECDTADPVVEGFADFLATGQGPCAVAVWWTGRPR